MTPRPDPEPFPALELSPEELIAEHTGRLSDYPCDACGAYAMVAGFEPEPRTICHECGRPEGRWVSLSRARLGPEEEGPSPY